MGMTRSEMDAELAKLYEQVPRMIGCDGRCWTTCGPIDMSPRERQRIRAAGVRITPYQEAVTRLDRFHCDALTGDRRCAIYDLRPLICRIWGAVEDVPCVYGCVPEGGYLTAEQAGWLVEESKRIGAGGRGEGGEAIVAAARRAPGVLEQHYRHGHQADLQHADEAIPAAFRRRPGQ